MKKIAIIHPASPCELQKRAIEVLSSMLLGYTAEYPVCIPCGAEIPEGLRRIYVGTKESNPYIAEHSEVELTRPEEYSVRIADDTVIIEGSDDAGALYGAIDLYPRYLLVHEYPNDELYIRKDPLDCDILPEASFSSAPTVSERGLWTWGHVIYDYKGYLDNMMMLKMNRVVIWNDFLPTNARDIQEYAHARNIKVIWGYAWLWDNDFSRLDMESVLERSGEIFEKFESEFGELDVDGIYFQTFTELRQDTLGGVLIAKAAAEFVNRTAALFYEKYPDIELQFGLHATSVRGKLEFIRTVDPRISIIWEDCGAFPFSYVPNDVGDFDATAELVREIAHLRGENERFGVVTKGLVKLDWTCFEHSRGAHCIGVSGERFKQNRVTRKSPSWRYIQANWISYAPKALEMVRIMRELRGGELCVLALVEDGMFEKNIMYPVALFAEMLWGCDDELSLINNRVALCDYVCFE